MLIPLLLTHAIQVADCRVDNARHPAICGPTPRRCTIRNYRDGTGVVVCDSKGRRWIASRTIDTPGAGASGAWTITSSKAQ